jgi:hypothetical protein
MINEFFENQHPIQIPEDLPNGRLLKRIARGIGGAVPGVGSLISEGIDAAFPDVNAVEERIWQESVTHELNWLRSFLGLSYISPDSYAWAIAVLAANIDVEAKGIDGDVNISDADILARYPQLAGHDIDEALAELSHADWILLGPPNPNTRNGNEGFYAKPKLFASLDPLTRGTSPIDDAKSLASLALSVEDDWASVPEIAIQLGWPNRRLYPALGILEINLPPDVLEKQSRLEYPFIHILMIGETRRRLRLFVKS